ncbi:hypothetical protein ABR763_19870 [Bacillus cereus]
MNILDDGKELDSKTLLYSDDAILIHEAILKQETLQKIKVSCFYMPKSFTSHWEKVQELDKSFMKLSTFREVIQSEYQDVICVNFSSNALMGLEPFLLLDNDGDHSTAPLIYEDFIQFIIKKINWVIQNGKNEIKKKIADRLYDQMILIQVSEIISQQFSVCTLDELLQMGSMNMYMKSWICNYYVKNVRRIAHLFQGLLLEGKNQRNHFHLPEKWYVSTYESDYEVVSEIRELKYEKFKKTQVDYFSYVINFNVELNQIGDLIIRPHLKVRSWAMNIERNGLIYMPDGKTRSFYVVKNSKLLRFKIQKYNGRIAFCFGYDIGKFIGKNLNGLELVDILIDLPKYKGQYMVPVMTAYDKSLGGENNLEPGVHQNEHLIIFRSFMETINLLELNHIFPEPVSHKNAKETLQQNVVVLDSNLDEVPTEITVEVIDSNHNIVEIAKAALRNLVEGKQPSNPEKTKDFSFRRFQLVDESENVIAFFDKQSAKNTVIKFNLFPNKEFLCNELCSDLDIDDSIYQRQKEIKEQLPIINKGTDKVAVLAAIKKMYGKKYDSYRAFKKGALEANRISQMYHPVEEAEDIETKMISSIKDILLRFGFKNQRIENYMNATKGLKFYFPVIEEDIMVNGTKGFIGLVFKIENGIEKVKYANSEWLDIYSAILHLQLNSIKNAIFTKEADVLKFVFETVKEDSDGILIFERAKVPEKVNMMDYKKPYVIISDSPYISNIQKGKVSSGKFIIKSNDAYYIVHSSPANMKMNQGMLKQTNNQYMAHIHPLKLNIYNVTKEEVEHNIAVGINSMRGISLTTNNFTKLPFVLHLYQNHFKSFLVNLKK